MVVILRCFTEIDSFVTNYLKVVKLERTVCDRNGTKKLTVGSII